MSRNFELLQKLGKELEMFDYGWETDLEPVAAPQPDVKPPQFDLEPAQRDEVMKLVQRVFLVSAAEAPRIVTFCGLEPGGDSGWICSRASEVLASQVAGSVCVVDANFREPGLHRHFGVECGSGLTEALQHNEPIKKLVRPLRPNLWLLTCGNQAEEWQALLGSDRTRARINELRAQFDYVMIDAPALNPGNDVVALGHASQGVVLVLKAHSSRREVAREAVKDFARAGVRVLGAVLSRRTFPIPDQIYKRL
jgi:Mrp family chromosome partitioning ATPase